MQVLVSHSIGLLLFFFSVFHRQKTEEGITCHGRECCFMGIQINSSVLQQVVVVFLFVCLFVFVISSFKYIVHLIIVCISNPER